jgi:hypothetical protein
VKSRDALHDLNPEVMSSFQIAHDKYGRGKALSQKEFSGYIINLRNIYTTYCDSLHGSNRSIFQKFKRFFDCYSGSTRPRTEHSHLFTSIFGDATLDKCSPTKCSFSFDTWGYDERVCTRDLKERATWKKIRSKYVKNESHGAEIPVNWDRLEPSETEFSDDPSAESVAAAVFEPVVNAVKTGVKEVESLVKRAASGKDANIPNQKSGKGGEDGEQVKEKLDVEEQPHPPTSDSTTETVTAVTPTDSLVEKQQEEQLDNNVTNPKTEDLLSEKAGSDSDFTLESSKTTNKNVQENSGKTSAEYEEDKRLSALYS